MMHKPGFVTLTLLTILAMLLAACAQPVPVAPAEAPAAPAESGGAAGGAAVAAPDEIVAGGVWRRISWSDASILNPILSADTASSDVHSMFFPGLLGGDPFTGETIPDGSMSESWEVSEDGLTWTFHLRSGITWSDGDPVDAADFKFTYDAIASDLVDTPRKSLIEGIESIETPDPMTVVVKFSEVRCDGLTNLGISWLPSHLYAPDFTDVMTNTLNTAPAVSAGPFIFKNWTRDDSIVVERNPTYWEGAPHMDGMIYKVVPDPGARLAQLQSGEVDVLDLQPEQIAAVQGLPDINVYNYKDDGYAYIGLNLANPANPQPGQDENGNLVDQDPHPILSDRNVRKAIAHSLDYQAIIDKVFLGQGYQIAANVLPAVEWAYEPSLQPYATDLEMAAQLLDEAGWVDSDGDGVREKDGAPLELSLLTNSGNTTREDLGVLVQDQLNSIGFKINFEAIDFGTLVDQLLGQTYDMVIIGWTGLGSDPNDDTFWHTKYDTPGSGFNFVSYHNPEVDQLLEQGVTVVGCEPEDRAEYYKQIQQIIHDDVPYVFVSGNVGNTGYTTQWGNIEPGPWSFYYNVHTWYDVSLQP
jgi:peptide/nickel transport system substrate-binding protein